MAKAWEGPNDLDNYDDDINGHTNTDYNDDDNDDNDNDDDGNDDADDDDNERVVKAWEGRQEPHASRPSAHPITHSGAKYLFLNLRNII